MAQNVKTVMGLAIANVKTFGGLAIASVKTVMGVDNTTVSGTSWVTAQTLGSLKSNQTLEFGCAIYTGGSSVTVTQIGRWIISGNSQTHVLRIRNSSGTDLGNVTVNASGAPSGEYLYGTLGTAITLSASTTYYLLSEETSGGDQLYDYDTAITTTSVMSAVAAAYYNGSVNAFGSSGVCYGPLSVKY